MNTLDSVHLNIYSNLHHATQGQSLVLEIMYMEPRLSRSDCASLEFGSIHQSKVGISDEATTDYIQRQAASTRVQY